MHHHAVRDPCAHGTSKCEPWSSLENVQDSNGPTCVLQIDHFSQHMRSSESALVTKSRTTDPTMAMTKNNKQCRTDTTRFCPCVYHKHEKEKQQQIRKLFYKLDHKTQTNKTIQWVDHVCLDFPELAVNHTGRHVLGEKGGRRPLFVPSL